MAFPVSLSLTEGMLPVGSNPGPYKVGSAFYILVNDIGTGIKAFKSTATDTTWTEQDSAGRPVEEPSASNGIHFSCAIDSSDRIHVLSGSTTSGAIYYYSRFDTSTDTWAIADRSDINLSGMNAPASTKCCLHYDSTRTTELVALVQGEVNTDMGASYEAVDAYHMDVLGTSWTGPIQVDGNGANNYYPLAIAGGTSGGTHLFITSNHATNKFTGRTLSSGNALSTAVHENTTVGSAQDGRAAESFDDAGTQRVIIPNATATATVYRFEEDGSNNIAKSSTFSVVVETNGATNGVVYDTTDSKLYCCYADLPAGGGDNDLWLESSTDGAATWGSPVEVQDAININGSQINSQVYVNGSDRVIGITYRDLSDQVYYTEYTLPSATNVTATLDTLTLTKFDTTVVAEMPTNVTATLDTLTLTKFDTTVQADVDVNVSATLDTLTLTPFTTTVQADVDTNVSATLDTLTFTSLDTTVQADVDSNISATLDTLTLTPLASTVQADVDVNVVATLDTLTFTKFDATVSTSSSVDITATLDTLTLTKFDSTVQANVDTDVTATLDTLTLSKFDTTVQADVDSNVSATLDTLTLTKFDANVQADVDTNVSATADTLTLTKFDSTVQADVDTNVSATLDTLTLTKFDTTVQFGADTNVNVTLGNLTLTKFDTVVQADVDSNISATLDTLSLTKFDATVQADVDTNVIATLDTLTLTKLDTTVVLTAATNVDATFDTLNLISFDVTVQADVDTNVSASLDTLTLSKFDTVIMAGAFNGKITPERPLVINTNGGQGTIYFNGECYFDM